MTESDFIAKLKYQTTEEGGRNGYALSGYRPHIEFDNYPEYLTSGSQTFLNKEKVYPGESVDARIKILGVEYFCKRLYKGKRFKFCEGRRIIGYGEIIEITNKDLEIENGQSEELFNINLFPEDIRQKIEKDFGEDAGKVIRTIQPFLLLHNELRSPRIIRSILFLTNGIITNLEEQLQIAKIDWRDILLAAEYEERNTDKPKRIRNFDNKFGEEQII